MFAPMCKPTGLITEILFRSFATKPISNRPVSPQLRFYLDTKSVYGAQQVVRGERCTKPSELDLFNENSKKRQFEKDTELLYAGSNGFRQARSIPKGISITQRQRYLRHLFRIPRGQPASLYPQAYVPDKDLGSRKKKINKL